MSIHFIGKKQDGVMTRFTYDYSDEEFETLMASVGGILPPGWVAWHFDSFETLTNSKRVQALIQRVPSVIALYGAQPSRIWIQVMLQDDVNKFKANITA